LHRKIYWTDMNIRLRSIAAAFTIALSSVLFSCSNDPILVEKFFANSDTYTEYTDQTPIELSTFRLDSVQTSGHGIVWVGHNKKKVIGDIYSQSYVRLNGFDVATAVSHNATYSGGTSNLSDVYSWAVNEKYDSVTIVLYHKYATDPVTKEKYSIYQGDTTKAMTINVTRLAQPIEFTEKEITDQKGFYNVRSFRDSIPIGSFKFKPRPLGRPRLRYRLNDEFGRDLVKFIKSNSSKKSEVRVDNFRRFLGGIKLEANDANSLLAFITDSVKIMLHTHITDVDKVRITRALKVNSGEDYSAYQFNTTQAKNQDSPYDKISNIYDQVTESKGGTHSVIFEGMGYYTRINFPTIKDIISKCYYSHIVRANLVIYPERDGYDKHNFPRTLYLAPINKGNVPISTYNVMAASLHYNLQDDKDVYYTADITNYLNTVLASGNVDVNDGLYITWNGTQLGTDYNFMVFNGHGKEKYYSYLELYYYDYDREER